MSDFWRRWIVIWCVTVALVGLLLMGAASPATDAIAIDLMRTMGPPTTPAAFDNTLRFTAGLMGAVTFGWGLTIWAAAGAAARHPEADAVLWPRVTGALLAWYLVDSAISIETGFVLNAVSNTLLMALWLAPMTLGGGIRRPQP